MDEKKNFSRETAKICPLDYLLKGEYVVVEGWQPNYVKIFNEKISRINIIGVVVEKLSPNTLLVDDGFATIKIIDFNNKNLSKIEISDPILIIGRPRKVKDELFISSEIITTKQLKNNPSWLTYRKQELLRKKQEMSKETEPLIKETEPVVKKNLVEETEQKLSQIRQEQLTGDDIIDFIKKKDDGEGAQIEDIINYFGSDTEEVINALLSDGEIFEIRPGRVKCLE